MEKLPLSVAVISFNEEHIIGKMLEAIYPIASEIIIVDSGSEDKTLEIAKGYNAKIFSEEWKGHVAQKNSALEKCTQDWILCLDCDEVCDSELLESISMVCRNQKTGSYSINRKTFYLGKMLEYAWQPDINLRLVHRSTNPEWHGIDPHDKLFTNTKASLLRGNLIHYSYKDLYHHISKLVKYSEISANSYYKAGKKFSLTKLILNPFAAFLRRYVVRNAWKDGIRGLLVGISTFIATFLKYAFLWEIEKKAKK